MAKYNITTEEYNEVLVELKRNKNKNLDRKLRIIKLRYEGLKDREIAAKLDCNRKVVSRICSEFKRFGIAEFIREKHMGNHRSLKFEEEKEILDAFRKDAENGKVVTVKDIKKKFDERLGKDTGNSYIYNVLKRHNWRKVMPRSKHPKKASEEEINSSKKLTIQWKKLS